MTAPLYGRCPTCGDRLQIWNVGHLSGRTSSYRRRCPTCGDAGAFDPTPPQLAEWREQMLTSLVRRERRHNPLDGDRRVWALHSVAPARRTDPLAHRESAADPHLLEVFRDGHWLQVGVATDEMSAVSWQCEPEQNADRAP